MKNFVAQFARYFIIGLSGTVLDVGTLYVFKDLLGLRAVIAVMFNQILIIIYVFTLNKHWSFKTSGGLTHLQFVRFLMVMGLNYVISISWMWLFNEHLKFNYLVVRLGNIILSMSWNFLLYKFFVYKAPKPCA